MTDAVLTDRVVLDWVGLCESSHLLPCGEYGLKRLQAKEYPGKPIYGGSQQVKALTNQVKDNDEFKIGDNIHVKYVCSIFVTRQLRPYPRQGDSRITHLRLTP